MPQLEENPGASRAQNLGTSDTITSSGDDRVEGGRAERGERGTAGGGAGGGGGGGGGVGDGGGVEGEEEGEGEEDTRRDTISGVYVCCSPAADSAVYYKSKKRGGHRPTDRYAGSRSTLDPLVSSSAAPIHPSHPVIPLQRSYSSTRVVKGPVHGIIRYG